MPRYEYIDHEGNSRILSTATHREAKQVVWDREVERTRSVTLADRAVGTVELSDERARSRR